MIGHALEYPESNVVHSSNSIIGQHFGYDVAVEGAERTVVPCPFCNDYISIEAFDTHGCCEGCMAELING